MNITKAIEETSELTEEITKSKQIKEITKCMLKTAVLSNFKFYQLGLIGPKWQKLLW